LLRSAGVEFGFQIKQFEMEREIEIDTERDEERDAFVSSQIEAKVLYK
jgi:hypothetical protein